MEKSYVREINSHQINECNQAIAIQADAPNPQNGNASHCYRLTIERGDGPFHTYLYFQDGPIKEVGTNGITHEALLAVLADRLLGFQSGPYACAENALALEHIIKAAEALHSRTKARVERGVEGTNVV